MSSISEADRNYIENKYHNTDEPFDPFDRFPYHGYEYDESTGLSDAEMESKLNELYEKTRGLPHCVAKAKGFAFVLDNMRIDVNKHDYFIGMYNWAQPLNKTFISKWYDDVFDKMPDIKARMFDYEESGTAAMWLDMAHDVPNWTDILALGFTGLLDRARRIRKSHEKKKILNKDQQAFFDSIEIEYEAMLRLVKRLYRYASEHKSDKSECIAQSLRHLYEGAPKNIFDALQLMYIYYMCSESIEQFRARSLGNGLDRSLYSYYKTDIENGTYTKGEIKKFLAYFFLQFSAIGDYWGQPFYLCGTDFDNKTDITDFTYDILEVYESLNIYNPKIQIKIDYNTPKDLIVRVLKIIRNGNTSFVFCCMPGIIKSLMSCCGATYEEARDCDISGCNETHIRANEACMISSLPNAAKAVCYVFNNGIDTVTGKQIGLKTGSIENFHSFEEFYSAFLKQWAYILDNAMEMARKYEHRVAEINPSVMLSATIEGSLEKITDAYAFGMKYPTSSILLCSFATAVNSVVAVKELVFEKKETTLTELRDALKNNWDGYEALRLKAINAHKYGNNDEEADIYACAMYNWFSIYVTGQKNSRGGIYKVGVPSTLHFISQGKLTEATPDGRKMGEECSKNAAPSVGTERKGVTAMIHSVLKASPYMFSEAHVLDVMLHPSVITGDEGLDAVYGLIINYMKNGGLCIQFNIFSSKMLRDAQKHPEKYKNLQVRVSGWNVLWNNLSKEEQEAYIIRAESICRE